VNKPYKPTSIKYLNSFLKEHLGERTANGKLNPEGERLAKIARIRTITVLTQLDGRRVGYVFAFLREAGLMSTASGDDVVRLNDANLKEVNWSQADLFEANLSGAFLNRADLSGANLGSTDLSGAHLSGAHLNGARSVTIEDLERQTPFLKGATMPDGSIHP
jgi:uncharacterized protein YjbI with pentapeptide repeats